MRRLYAIALVGCSFEPSAAIDASATPGDGSPVASDAPTICPARYTDKFGGHSYFGTGVMDWAAGKAECEQDIGTLMKIESPEENAELHQRLDDMTVPRVWIGLSDLNDDGIYEWVDGTVPTYVNWDTVPTAANSSCVYLGGSFLGEGGRWYTNDCASNRPAVCECDGP